MSVVHPSPSVGGRVVKFALIGAVIGAVIMVLKVAIFNSFDFGHQAVWWLLVVLGAVAGGVIALLFSAAGQSGPET
jgi:hypothetical protein